MRVAMTIWQGHVSPVFDVCRQAVVLTVQRGRVVSESTRPVRQPDPRKKIRRLLELGVEVLICGAISTELTQELVASGVCVISFVAGETERVFDAWFRGNLPSPEFTMPGCHPRIANGVAAPTLRRGKPGRTRG